MSKDQQINDHGVQRLLKFIPLAAVVFLAIVGWAALRAESQTNTRGVNENKLAIAETQRSLNTVKETVIRIEEAQKYAEKSAAEMSIDIKDILSTLRSR